MLVNACASKDLVANWPRSLLHMHKRHRHTYIHTCVCIGGGGTEQVFELISFISPAATTRRPLAPRRFPCGPLIHGDRLHDIYTLPSDFIFGYRTRASFGCISSRCYARLHAGKYTPYLPAICARRTTTGII